MWSGYSGLSNQQRGSLIEQTPYQRSRVLLSGKGLAITQTWVHKGMSYPNNFNATWGLASNVQVWHAQPPPQSKSGMPSPLHKIWEGVETLASLFGDSTKESKGKV